MKWWTNWPVNLVQTEVCSFHPGGGQSHCPALCSWAGHHLVLKVWKGRLTFHLPAESRGSPCQGAKPKALTYHQGFLFELHIRSEAFAAHGRRAPTLLGPESQLLWATHPVSNSRDYYNNPRIIFVIIQPSRGSRPLNSRGTRPQGLYYNPTHMGYQTPRDSVPSMQ